MTHPNEELSRSEMEAALRGDFEGMLAHYTDDAILHYPGRNALSGTYRGETSCVVLRASREVVGLEASKGLDAATFKLGAGHAEGERTRCGDVDAQAHYSWPESAFECGEPCRKLPHLRLAAPRRCEGRPCAG
jgi:ketosteroid isomerase-like protein